MTGSQGQASNLLYIILLALDKNLLGMSGSTGVNSSDISKVRHQQLVCSRVIQPIVAMDRMVDQVPDKSRRGHV